MYDKIYQLCNQLCQKIIIRKEKHKDLEVCKEYVHRGEKQIKRDRWKIRELSYRKLKIDMKTARESKIPKCNLDEKRQLTQGLLRTLI